MQQRGDRLRRGIDMAEVGGTVRAQGGGHGDEERLRLRRCRLGAEAAFSHGVGDEPVEIGFAERRLAVVHPRDDAGVAVAADHRTTVRGEDRRGGQADKAEPDHADPAHASTQSAIAAAIRSAARPSP